MKRIRRILVATDFSRAAEKALDIAAELGGRFEASLAVLHVYQAPPLPIPTYPVPPSSSIANLAKLVEDVDRALTSLRQALGRRGLADVTTLAAEGAPVDEILRELREGKYDLLVMGTHGRGTVGHALLGSVAEEVVRGAPCPVLTIRDSIPGEWKSRPESRDSDLRDHSTPDDRR
jgi:nucleotide-binding universal stress UspA family protein